MKYLSIFTADEPFDFLEEKKTVKMRKHNSGAALFSL
jgi:hypothetical protein